MGYSRAFAFDNKGEIWTRETKAQLNKQITENAFAEGDAGWFRHLQAIADNIISLEDILGSGSLVYNGLIIGFDFNDLITT